MKKYTAQGAPVENNEVIKVRMQATPNEINGFKKMLEKCEELGMCQVMNFSDLFSNKGTTKYFRAYSDVRINEEVSHE